MPPLHDKPDSSIEAWVKSVSDWMDAVQRSLPAATESSMHSGLSGVARASKAYWDQQAAIWASLWQIGAQNRADNADMSEDKRFLDPEWRDHPWYNAIRQSYFANSQLIADVIESADLDASIKEKLRFFANQLVDAASPANFAATNPEVARLARESGGKSIVQGLANLCNDLARRQISITDETAFEVGRNVAVSPGSVVFECELMELIQYAPLTEQVACRPLLIVPPCVNKFYILDLQPANSFVRHACEQGYTVFLVSWRNPDASLGHLRWDDYVEHGVLQAIRIARSIDRCARLRAGSRVRSYRSVAGSIRKRPADRQQAGVRTRFQRPYRGRDQSAVGKQAELPDRQSSGGTPDAWLAGAPVHPGSWWTHWSEWLRRHAGETVAAPVRPGNETWLPLAPAPGRYVKVRSA